MIIVKTARKAKAQDEIFAMDMLYRPDYLQVVCPYTIPSSERQPFIPRAADCLTVLRTRHPRANT